jgi:superfamily I DNA/RNA helicase
MKFQDLPVEILSIRVASTDGSSLERHLAGRASIDIIQVSPSEAEGIFDLALRDSMLSVTPTRQADSIRLTGEMRLGRAQLAQILNPASDGSVDLNIAFFVGSILEMGDLEIGIDEYVEAGAKRIAEPKTIPDIYSWMEERCAFTHGGKAYFFLSAGPAIAKDLSDVEQAQAAPPSETGAEGTEGLDTEDQRNQLNEHVRPQTKANLRNSFCITGSALRFVATTATLPGGASIYVAKKLTELQQNHDRTIHLAKGGLKFCDWTKTGQIQLQAKAQLGDLTAGQSSYLKKWDEFGNLEGELLLRTAREIGTINFSDPRSNRDGTVDVHIDEASGTALEAMASGRLTDVEIVEEAPLYLNNPDFSFASFSAELQEDDLANSKTIHSFKIIRYDRETKTLTLEADSILFNGMIIMSMIGHVAQIKRRLQARRRILEGRSANPQLGLLIEERGKVIYLRSPRVIKPLTAFVRNKVFKNPPTERQERAIEVALNTPDIALIQGPPGTGKTTVIAAILERLNEIATTTGMKGPGQVLLSGFQHDAVENMIDRMSINGIPVPKFGRRSGDDETGLTAFERKLEEWCAKIAREVKEKNPQIAELEAERTVKDLHKQYLRTPTRKLGKALLNGIASVGTATLGEDVVRRVVALNRHLTVEEKSNQIRYLSAVQRIRTRPESFADDGPERAEEALVDLGDVLNEQQSALLNKAATWPAERGEPFFLAELAQMKRGLLVLFTAPPVFRVEKHNDELLRLVDEAIELIRHRGLTSKDKRAAALVEFLAELESNPSGMVDAISQFSYAFSATAQQSVNKEMQRRKGLIDSKTEPRGMEYEYVIIDEAARVSPHDLMIPMSQGKKIILVGDHRQLPHIIEEEVARRIEEGADNVDEGEWLKKSMFEYLFSERLKALEEQDGIQRRVTLDKQFRMHPELGSFVSRNFYERFDADEKFGSGLPAETFSHHLPNTNNKPAIWLPVPASVGPEKRERTSWTRDAEVDAITRQLKAWIESTQGRDLSYGIISYYKAQADLIRRRLKSALGSLADDDKKIRVGTVDSFQGMEFDVVFLSVVRTSRSGPPRSQNRAKEANSRFGRLCLYNLLNVSMSRQKRLLVTVGDPAIVADDLAMEFIPGLVDFYALATEPRPRLARDRGRG